MVVQTALFHAFAWLIFHCVHGPLLLCAFICVDGHFGCIQVLAMVNISAVQDGQPVSF